MLHESGIKMKKRKSIENGDSKRKSSEDKVNEELRKEKEMRALV